MRLIARPPSSTRLGATTAHTSAPAMFSQANSARSRVVSSPPTTHPVVHSCHAASALTGSHSMHLDLAFATLEFAMAQHYKETTA